MTRLNGSILISRPVEEVFDFVADERNEPACNPQMRSVEKTTPGSIGVGTLWHVVTTSRRRATPFELEVTEYAAKPPGIDDRMASADITRRLTFVPHGKGTLMSWSWDLRPKGMLKLATPLFALLGRRQEQRI